MFGPGFKNNASPKKAFTLVELLVVIAITALLVAILVPSLQKARELAKQVVCSSRQRQLALALTSYTQEYDGYIMPYSTVYQKGATSNTQLWVGPHGSYDHGMTVAEEYWYAMLYVAKGIDNRDIFFCPSLSPSNNSQYKIRTGKNLEDRVMGWTYGLRDWAIRDGTQWVNDRAPKKITKMPRPSDFFLIADTVTYDPWNRTGFDYRHIPADYGQMFVILDYGRAVNWGYGGVHLRHSDKAGAVFADGHAEFKPMQYWCDLQNPKNWQAQYRMDKPGYKVYDKPVRNEWLWRGYPAQGYITISVR
jgi:prepilin-type N-terminal cleavage/methylation domain-containing protein/prepilin-type processing-associated H-X9-DG protein